MIGSIQINNVSKKFKQYPNKKARLIEWLMGGKKKYHIEHWPLKGITFSTESGESVGIIGQNGAGKSTLLKLLTGTSQPTHGSIHAHGSISALLELGMGYDPELTGRQNSYITGQLMGLTNHEIEKLMPQIEEFAEVGKFFDQPIRTYSSGMIVRVAFAAATAVRPDILIIDEALSVGDAYFQQKCFSRIREFKKQGTTLLFVSHDPGAVKSLCERAVLLDEGLLIKEGSPDEVLDYYNAVIAKREADYQIEQTQGTGVRKSIRSGDGAIRIKTVTFLHNNKAINAIQVGDQITVQVAIESFKETNNPTIGFMFKDRLGNEVFGTNTYYLGFDVGKIERQEIRKINFTLPCNFGVGNYSLSVAIHKGYSHLSGNHDWWDQAATLQVIPGSEATFVGVCYVPVSCEIKLDRDKLL